MNGNALIKADYLRNLAVEYGRAFIGTPYKWAGDDFSGFDCSGFVVEVLQAVGILPHKRDYSAHDLYSIFKPNVIRTPSAGCLAFWMNDAGRVVHVMLCVDKDLVIGASGGGSFTTTTSDAIRDNAFVLMRPITYRKGPVVVVDPFQGVEL